MADPAARKLLNGLIKREDLGNKICCDCPNPNPQWASLGFAVFLCLQCAGTHRGFGVHISFVRSVTMDAWQEDQLRRMELGGNKRFRDFAKSYDPSSGGYKEGSSPYDTYHCWAATQYREKLDAELAGKDWSPSAPPPTHLAAPNNNNNGNISRSASPNPTQGLRKSRAGGASATNARSNARSGSPASSINNNSPSSSGILDQKSQNEAYFASLGKMNESRSADLPPSQGGRYQGFGSTPTPPPGGAGGNPSHPSFGLSSANAPTLSDLQENPMAALSKGWSLFSAAVAGATKVVSENVIQPGMERVRDPEFQASVKGYVGEAQRRAAGVGGVANEWSKQQFGVDVADTVYGVKERVLGGPARSGYGQVSSTGEGEGEEGSALYHDEDEDDFFKEYSQAGKSTNGVGAESDGWGSVGDPTPAASVPVSMRRPTAGKVTSRAKATKKDDDWDEWKDF